MPELTDHVRRVQNGEWEAFEYIVQCFQDMAVGYSYSILGDRQIAEDAAQEAFINAFYEIGSLRDPTAFPGWFRKIVFKYVDRIRRERWWTMRQFVELEQIQDQQCDPQAAAEQEETNGLLLTAIRSLQEAHRATWVLFYFSGYSQKEISTFLEIPIGTVKTRLHIARKRLRERLLEINQNEFIHLRPSRDTLFVKQIQAMIPAIMEGDHAQVKHLLRKDPALAHQSGHVDSALWKDEVPVLQVAVMYGRKDIVNLLLANGVDINERDPKSGFTALMQALDLAFMPDYADLGMDEFLRERGAELDLISLLWRQDFDGVKELLDHHPQAVQTRGPDGIPAIVFAGSQPIAQLLVDHGADLLAQFTTPNGLTNPIRCYANWWANNFDGMDLLRFFLEKAGIPMDIYIAAVLDDIPRLHDLILEDPSLVNAFTQSDYVLEPGFTALHFAAQFGHTEIAQILIENDADINAASPIAKGQTPLHVAVRLGIAVLPSD